MIPCAKEFFKVKDQCNFIMDRIIKACYYENEEIQHLAFKALAEVPAVAVAELYDWLGPLKEITSKKISSNRFADIEKILEFWTNACMHEVKQNEYIVFG